ncbi:MAG TPA: hypothetical protein VJQ54_16795 [Candidatus Sulfotelmatobacter sp.]|nr:hypothetical protein [Candidatus Sulfotelmatobacter sp.]
MQPQSFTHDKPTCVRAQIDKNNGLFSVALYLFDRDDCKRLVAKRIPMQACWPSRDRRDALPATFKNGACSRLRNRYRVTSAAPRRTIIIARLVGKLNHALDRSEKLLSEGVTALLRALWANARSYSECRAQCDN